MSPLPPVGARRSEPAASVLHRVRPAHLLMAVAIIVVLVVVARFVDQPSFVDRISFENPTAYDLSVEVTNGRGGVIAVGTARRNETTILYEVFDVGDNWVFRFGAQGEQGGELRASRSRLTKDDWKVRIPLRVGDQLRTAGAPPSF